MSMARARNVSAIFALITTVAVTTPHVADARAGRATPERPWLAASQTLDQRVEQLLDRMTLDEEVRLLYGVQPPDGIYSPGYVPGNDRLGIPPTIESNGSGGIRDWYASPVRRPATALPAPIALAASFDPALAHDYGSVIGMEARAKRTDRKHHAQHSAGMVVHDRPRNLPLANENDGALLPLDPAQLHSIAIVGPYAAQYFPGGSGSGQVKPYYTVTPVAGAEARLGTGVSVVTADGSDLTAAANLAQTSDAAVVVVNDKEGEGHDRTSLTLPGNQNALIDAVRQANPRTVVVLLTGGPVDMPWLGQVPAVLQAWYPGEEGGNALTAVLFGDVNPSGKLPISLPTSLADSPVSGPPQYPAVSGHYSYSEGLRIGYRWYDTTGVAPLFPFGFGLSYTSFDFANLGVTTNGSAVSPTVQVSVDVTNTGPRRGAEVAQVYLRSAGGHRRATAPPRRLRQGGPRPGADPAGDPVGRPGRPADLGHCRPPVGSPHRHLRRLRR